MSENVVITASIWRCDNFIPAPINVDNLHGHATIGWALLQAAETPVADMPKDSEERNDES
jgi:hypothetical protein